MPRVPAPVTQLLLLSLALPAASSAETTLSVLNFENVSADSGLAPLGKAFAEIMVADLSRVQGLKLIERENMEKVLREQALGQTGALDSASSPQVGKLLGAQYLVMGSYTVVKRDIVVNYRIVNAESGSILNAGCASGSARRTLEVTGRLGVAIVDGLTKTLPGIKAASRSGSTASDLDVTVVAAYGKALDLQDKGDFAAAKDVLSTLVTTSPGFSYGATALAALERRIQDYDRERQKKLDQQAHGPVTWQTFNQTALSYTTSMKYSALIKYCESVRPNPPAAPEGAMTTAAELIGYYITLGSYMLKRWDRTAAEGEEFLKKYPASMYYGPVKTYVTQAANEMASIKSRKQQADQEAGELIGQLKGAPADKVNALCYQIGSIYYGKQLYAAALEYYRRYDFRKAGEGLVPADLVLFNVFMCYYGLTDRAEASRVAEAIRSQFPQSSYLSSVQSMMTMFPE